MIKLILNRMGIYTAADMNRAYGTAVHNMREKMIAIQTHADNQTELLQRTKREADQIISDMGEHIAWLQANHRKTLHVTSDTGGDMTPEIGDVQERESPTNTGVSDVSTVSKSKTSPPAATIIPPSDALLEAFRS